ncbi:MAG: PAS domain-containing protein [Campylobacterales bacterium]|nr:PAS domain-containing protein [Campylobacterales bacterium]
MKSIWGVEIKNGISILDVIQNENDRKKAKLNFDKALEGEKFVLREDYGNNKFMRTTWENQYFPLYDDNNVIIGLGIIEQELTKQIQLESDYHEAKLFRTLANFSTSGISLADATDKELPLIFVNDSFCKITGYSKEEVIGKNCRFLQSHDTKQHELNILREAIKTKQPCQVELRNYKKDGTLFYNLLSLTPIFDENNELQYYAGIQTDITDLKILSQRLYTTEKLSAMSEMISNIAHQWRQPLSIITTVASNIKILDEIDSLQAYSIGNDMSIIINYANYLSKIIDEFKEFTISERDSNFELNEIFENIEIDKEIKIIKELDNNIKLNTYKNQFIKAIVNIIQNAEDAFASRTSDKYLFIKTYQNKNYIFIEIQDSAGGIADTIKDKIFEPYFTTKHQSQGTGLGLYTTYNFISSINGLIEIKNIDYTYESKNLSGVQCTIKIPVTLAS